MFLRIAKTVLAGSAGVLILLVGINNILDYQANFEVVRHILSMDALPKDSALTWRAITAPALHHAVYWFIIVTELAAALICLRGAWAMQAALNGSAAQFQAAKLAALLGLALAFWLYFFGFMAIGGEWFQMWRAGDFNMQQPAFRFIGMVGLLMIFIGQGEGE